MVTKEKSLLEKVEDEFNKRTDSLILDYQSIPTDGSHTALLVREIKIDMLKWAKANLKAIVLNHQIEEGC